MYPYNFTTEQTEPRSKRNKTHTEVPDVEEKSSRQPHLPNIKGKRLHMRLLSIYRPTIKRRERETQSKSTNPYKHPHLNVLHATLLTEMRYGPAEASMKRNWSALTYRSYKLVNQCSSMQNVTNCHLLLADVTFHLIHILQSQKL